MTISKIVVTITDIFGGGRNPVASGSSLPTDKGPLKIVKQTIKTLKKFVGKQHVYALLKTDNYSEFIMPKLQCLGLLGLTRVSLSHQKLHATIALGKSLSANWVLPWSHANNLL